MERHFFTARQQRHSPAGTGETIGLALCICGLFALAVLLAALWG